MSIIVDSNKLLYVVKRSSFGVRIDVLDEWIKWLSYVNDDDEKYLSENNKSLKEMSLEELKKYQDIQSQLLMCELFKKYSKKQCSKEEHDIVYNYMNNSIIDLMNTKINDQEREEIEKILKHLKKQSIVDVEGFIELKLKNYKELSKVDAYVLHFISIYNYDRICDQKSEEIKQNSNKRNMSLRKSLIKDYGIF
ncbi:MAG: hypothetical protein V8Q71_02120 [Bacilli bacterium]